MTSQGSDEVDSDRLSCVDRYDPRRDPIEFSNLLALIALGTGVVFICVGYLVPRDYQFDPHKPAREMERMSIEAERHAWALDMCIMMGMSCIAVGALMLACILSYLLVTGEIIPICGNEDEDESEALYPMSDKDRGKDYKDYGTGDDAKSDASDGGR